MLTIAAACGVECPPFSLTICSAVAVCICRQGSFDEERDGLYSSFILFR